MPSMTIDGRVCDLREGDTILSAARRAGIDIPTLCHLRERNDIASCRVCVVEVEGSPYPEPACSTPARAGMEVRTSSDELYAYRRIALDLIISDHGLNSTNFCFSCDKNGACELQDVCRRLGVESPSFPNDRPQEGKVDSNPFLSFDPNLCIRCQRCVGACNRAAVNRSLGTRKRGVRTAIEAPFGPDWRMTDCESCGNCAQACPTGALTEKRRAAYRSWETSRVRTTCPHCGVGCQLDLIVKDGRILDAEAAWGAPNRGLLCVKGRSSSFDFAQSSDRLTTPLVRNAATGELEPASWDAALGLVASRLGAIRDESGGSSIAAFACSRSTNEDVYLFQKMARVAFRTTNIDNCARV